MKKISAMLALALVCVGPAVAAKPPNGGKPKPTVTIRSSAAAVTFGRTVTLSGSTKNVAPGTSVELQQNPYPYRGFTASGKTAVVDPAGNWSVAGIVSQVHTQYRVIAKSSPPAQSSGVLVRVRLRVSLGVSDRTPKKGARVRFFGTVAPAHNGKPVLIQKKTATGYRTVSRTTLRANGTTSKYSKKLRIRSNGTYRVVAESLDQDHDNGTSRSRTLRVH